MHRIAIYNLCVLTDNSRNSEGGLYPRSQILASDFQKDAGKNATLNAVLGFSTSL